MECTAKQMTWSKWLATDGVYSWRHLTPPYCPGSGSCLNYRHCLLTVGLSPPKSSYPILPQLCSPNRNLFTSLSIDDATLDRRHNPNFRTWSTKSPSYHLYTPPCLATCPSHQGLCYTTTWYPTSLNMFSHWQQSLSGSLLLEKLFFFPFLSLQLQLQERA